MAALGAGNPPQALREWCAVNEDKMRRARLDAAWGRIALERLAPLSNPERVVGKRYSGSAMGGRSARPGRLRDCVTR